jgi:hypothetical protein
MKILLHRQSRTKAPCAKAFARDSYEGATQSTCGSHISRWIVTEPRCTRQNPCERYDSPLHYKERHATAVTHVFETQADVWMWDLHLHVLNTQIFECVMPKISTPLMMPKTQHPTEQIQMYKDTVLPNDVSWHEKLRHTSHQGNTVSSSCYVWLPPLEMHSSEGSGLPHLPSSFFWEGSWRVCKNN